MIDLETKELISKMTDDLEHSANRNLWDAIMMMTNYKEASSAYAELMDDVMEHSGFRMLDGVVFFFSGMIYVPVPRPAFNRSIELFLKRMHVRPAIMFDCCAYLQRKAWESITLNKPLRPTFNVWAFQNGVVDFAKGTVLMPFSSEFHVVYIHPYRYDPKATCYLWNKFLREVLPEEESRLILQMFMGLATYDRGYMTSKVENCLVLYGGGANGKSVIQQTMMGIFGDENISHKELKQLTRSGDEELRVISSIDGKLMNFASELRAKDLRGHEDAFKKLVSGEPQAGRRIGGNVYEVTNIPWLVFNTNNMLEMEDTSTGVQRRIIYLVFGTSIAPSRQNPRLAYELRAEYPGILNWIVRGAKKLKKLRFQFPVSPLGNRFLRLSEGESDVVMSWVHARKVRFVPDDEYDVPHYVSSNAIMQDIENYSLMNGFTMNLPNNMLSRALTKASCGLLHRKRTSGGVFYVLYGFSEEDLDTPVPILTEEGYMVHDSTIEDELYDDL